MCSVSPRCLTENELVFIRPRCLISRGQDGVLGTEDDLQLDCTPELVNQHILLDAGLKGDAARNDAYGRKIRFIHSGNVLLAWSYGQDGKPDTKDDQVARIAATAVGRN